MTTLREPLDFDHPLFYVVFGLGVGLASVLVLKLLSGFDRGLLLGAYHASSALALLTGVYFLAQRPLSVVHGDPYRHWTSRPASCSLALQLASTC